MRRNCVKAEIEVLSVRGVRFLTEVYLPQKLKHGQWHD
jgi:DNA topoisomerase VI subunit A